MKKTLLTLAFFGILIAGFSQRFEVKTFTDPQNFKRHFTYSIEGGFVDNLPRQFIAGNGSDFLLSGGGAIELQGNSVAVPMLYGGRKANFPGGSIEKMLLTDFVVPKQGGNALYGYGTGVYFPNGASLSSFPFFAIYERKTMEVIRWCTIISPTRALM